MLKEKIDLELGASQALHSIYGGRVWYLSGVTVFRLERLGTGSWFRNTLPIKEEWLEMVNCNCGQTVCVLNKGTALY